ncbi:hypothetical protein GOODEAATRI_013296 [Goodea atripinnis]|uniref:Uncharacterized protein n=1 Tax=Goodea atripinnis TaxID=208336 RepID=A0ABV0P3S9_9TELE
MWTMIRVDVLPLQAQPNSRMLLEEGGGAVGVWVLMQGRRPSLFKRSDLRPTFHTSLAEEAENKDSVEARLRMQEEQNFHGSLQAHGGILTQYC